MLSSAVVRVVVVLCVVMLLNLAFWMHSPGTGGLGAGLLHYYCSNGTPNTHTNTHTKGPGDSPRAQPQSHEQSQHHTCDMLTLQPSRPVTVQELPFPLPSSDSGPSSSPSPPGSSIGASPPAPAPVSAVPSVSTSLFDSPSLFPPVELADPSIQLFLHYHSEQAIQDVLWSPSVCSLRAIVASCGNGNYGTTMMRFLAAIKLGILLNTTVFISNGPMFVHVLHVPLWQSLVTARERMGCPMRDNGGWEDLKEGQVRFTNPPHPEFNALSQHWPQHNCTTLHYPVPAEHVPLVASEWSVYRRLRCENVFDPASGLFGRQYTLLQFADKWHAWKLLEINPYYRALNGHGGTGTGTTSASASASASGTHPDNTPDNRQHSSHRPLTSLDTDTDTDPTRVPSDVDGSSAGVDVGVGLAPRHAYTYTYPSVVDEADPLYVQAIRDANASTDFRPFQLHKSLAPPRSLLVCGLLRHFFRVDADIARVVDRLTGGTPFDYFFHVRSVRGGTAEELIGYVISQLTAEWADWNRTHTHTQSQSQSQSRSRAEAQVGAGANTQRVTTSTPTASMEPPPPPHPARRIYIMVDYGNKTQICHWLTQAVPWLSCHWFSVPVYLSSVGGGSLPVSLSVSPGSVHSSARGQGWGEAPMWAAIVDMYATVGARYGWTNIDSAYGRLIAWLAGPAQDCSPRRGRTYMGSPLPDHPYRLF